VGEQGDLFRPFKADPPPKTLTYPAGRPPGVERAGTVIDHTIARRVYGRRPKRKGLGLMGYVDPGARVFQSGGERHTRKVCPPCGGEGHGGFEFYAKNLITWADDIHRQLVGELRKDVDSIEMVDNCSNTVLRLAMDVMEREVERYDNKLGPRWGVVVEWWEVVPYRGPKVRFETDSA